MFFDIKITYYDKLCKTLISCVGKYPHQNLMHTISLFLEHAMPPAKRKRIASSTSNSLNKCPYCHKKGGGEWVQCMQKSCKQWVHLTCEAAAWETYSCPNCDSAENDEMP